MKHYVGADYYFNCLSPPARGRGLKHTVIRWFDSQIPPAKPEAWEIMDRSKRLAVLDSSENMLMVFDYRAIVIPAALLSRNPADFRRLVYSYSQRFKLTTDTFKGPDETQEPGFRLKHCRNDDLTPGNVKLCESRRQSRRITLLFISYYTTVGRFCPWGSDRLAITRFDWLILPFLLRQNCLEF